MGQENLEKAELALKQAIKLKSDFAFAHYNLGFILKDQGRLKEAETYIKKHLRLILNSRMHIYHYQLCQQVIKTQKWHNQLFSENLKK